MHVVSYLVLKTSVRFRFIAARDETDVEFFTCLYYSGE